MKKFLEEFNKRWEELKKKIEESKNSEKCETIEAKSGNSTYYIKSSKLFPSLTTTKVLIKKQAFKL